MIVERLVVGRRRFDVLADAVRARVDAREVDVGVDAAEDGAENRENDEDDDADRYRHREGRSSTGEIGAGSDERCRPDASPIGRVTNRTRRRSDTAPEGRVAEQVR